MGISVSCEVEESVNIEAGESVSIKPDAETTPQVVNEAFEEANLG